MRTRLTYSKLCDNTQPADFRIVGALKADKSGVAEGFLRTPVSAFPLSPQTNAYGLGGTDQLGVFRYMTGNASQRFQWY